MNKILNYCELVVRKCAHVYGSNPCSAAVGVTGDFKCYNTAKTCQDPQNFLGSEEQVLRFAEPSADLPDSIDAIPCITSISRRPQVVKPADGIGVRESVTVSMHNFIYNDFDLDPYPESRDFNPEKTGTFWGKFSARFGSLEGAEFRTIDGFVGQTLEQMRTRFYIVDRTQGADSRGNFSFTVNDALKLLDDEKAQWPQPSSGTLSNSITPATTSFTLSPSGVGSTYNIFGTPVLCSIGNEVILCTRTGDTINVTQRGARGTTASTHELGATFQEAGILEGQNPAFILSFLSHIVGNIDDEYSNFTENNEEVNAFLGRLYSCEVMRPTPIKKLLEELTRETGTIIYTDLERKKINMKVMRLEQPRAIVNDDQIAMGSISSKTLTAKRVSDVWVYHGKINPLEKQDELKNYSVIYAAITQDPSLVLENLPRSIRDIKSRFITSSNTDAAIDVAQRVVARYEKPPRQISLKVPRQDLNLTDLIQVESFIFENSQGQKEKDLLFQITSQDEKDGFINLVAEEMRFGQVSAPPDGIRRITIAADELNVNLIDKFNLQYVPPQDDFTVLVDIKSSAIIGSSSNTQPAFDVGDWSSFGVNVSIEIIGEGRIQGRGGDSAKEDGTQNGGLAFYTRRPVTVLSSALEFWGGGGAGESVIVSGNLLLGGGGQGSEAGSPNGTTEAGGIGQFFGASFKAGDGGSAGQSGQPSSGSGTLQTIPAGAGGAAVDGTSFITYTSTPDIRGAQVN